MDMLTKFLDTCLKERYEDNATDRLSYKQSTWLLLGFAVLLGGGHYFVGKPLQCWVPAQFTGGWEEYVEDYCYVENTYYLPFNQSIPRGYGDRESRMLNYYQWVPFVLALMALMFAAPHFVFRRLNWLSGINLGALVKMTTEQNVLDLHVPHVDIDKLRSKEKALKKELRVMRDKAADPDPHEIERKSAKLERVAEKLKEKRKEAGERPIKVVAEHLANSLAIENYVSYNSNPLGWLFRLLFLSHGCYVTALYILMKVANVANLVLQFVILKHFLGTGGLFWGIGLFGDLLQESTWTKTGLFPRVTMCDVEVRVLGNLHRHTVQCVLQINMFNEKVFLFLWYFFALLLIVTLVDFLKWLTFAFLDTLKVDYVRTLLDASDEATTALLRTGGDFDTEDFVKRFLKADGVTTLRLIEANSGDTVASLVAGCLCAIYVERKIKKQEARAQQPERQPASFYPKWLPPNYNDVDTMPAHKPAYV